MMALPLKYNVRNVLTRWRATLATVMGIAMVVAVFVMVQSLAVGLEKSSSNTGDPANLMIVRKGSTAESSSIVTREQFKLIQYWPEIARDQRGHPLVSADVIILINVDRRDRKGEANVLVRGLSPMGRVLRPQVGLVGGRWHESGRREVVVSRRLADRFAHFQIGDRFKTAGEELTVVGWMDGGNSAFDSEVWMDADEARSLFDREYFSSVLARVQGADPAGLTNLTGRVASDKRLSLLAIPETSYYAKQTTSAIPIKILGSLLATVMSVGAVFAAMNTMYASVGARTREIGTLRVLGYRRRTVLAAFIIEGTFLAALGGVLGCLLSLPLDGFATGTMGFETFSEVVFDFQITPDLFAQGMTFALVVGVAGSFLPAMRAARLPVIASLKSV